MADTLDKPVQDTGYDADFYVWTQEQAALLRQAARDRINAPIDWENVAEEIESLGKRDKEKVGSLTHEILVHLIKLRASPSELPRNAWKKELRAFRDRIERTLNGSPALRAQLRSMVEQEWEGAFRDAKQDLVEFGEGPAAEPYLVLLKHRGPKPDEVLDRDFYPDFGKVD